MLAPFWYIALGILHLYHVITVNPRSSGCSSLQIFFAVYSLCAFYSTREACKAKAYVLFDGRKRSLT